MVIQVRILSTLVVLSAVFALGIAAPSAADPVAHDTDSVKQALPLSLEPSLDEGGSSRLSASTQTMSPVRVTAVIPDTDPWAEALAESSRLGAILTTGESPRYPLVLNPQVKFFLNRFTGDRRSIVGLWLSRSSRYLAMIRQVLRNRGLPEDLAFTAMIESGFNPVAVSRAGAAGLWQFMATTARRYGLRVDHWVDERLDPEKSTVAAASYFRDLYQQFGSWMLAQAAYNAGDVKVTKAIRATGSTDFWRLAETQWLRRETKDFVPQIQAATMIGRDPAQYGFETRDADAVLVESVSVPPWTDLDRLSTSSGIPPETLHELNPTLVRGVTPPGDAYALRVPAGTGSGVLAAIDAARTTSVAIGRVPIVTGRAAGRADVHVVRPRDTVSAIAQHYGVSVGDVLRWNSLERHDAIRPGDRLRITERRLSSERDRQTSVR